eukprot:TRINITY_DN25094_c0_g1_i1.p1 TRINITY_DN25094_c0_g1~~TRINITY_DN25094_c0_g1_i1.p1  ORF type:complete len:346 (+),score=48.59 TRINITY_DN25094_c0_g1_i1:2-1039(+)
MCAKRGLARHCFSMGGPCAVGKARPRGGIRKAAWPLVVAAVHFALERQTRPLTSASVRAVGSSASGVVADARRVRSSDSFASAEEPEDDMSHGEDADELLETLLAIERSCKEGSAALKDSSSSGAQPLVGGSPSSSLHGRRPSELLAGAAIESILDEEDAQCWLLSSPGSPFLTGCISVWLPGVEVEWTLQALIDATQRSRWDHETLRENEVLQERRNPLGPDYVRCVIPVPRPASERETLQLRWVRVLPDGGKAVIMRSFTDDSILPQNSKYVRAFTHISGYLLRPRDGGLEVVGISQSDMAGSIPGWVQNFVRRVAKQKPITWAAKLGAHSKKIKEEHEESLA